jgi:hypothetical protein
MSVRQSSQRRLYSRFATMMPVQLITTSRYLKGALEDLSLTGARVRVPEPPDPGRDVVLRWDGREVFGHVAWTGDDVVGVAFDKPISAMHARTATDAAEGNKRR